MPARSLRFAGRIWTMGFDGMTREPDIGSHSLNDQNGPLSRPVVRSLTGPGLLLLFRIATMRAQQAVCRMLAALAHRSQEHTISSRSRYGPKQPLLAILTLAPMIQRRERARRSLPNLGSRTG